MEQNFRNLKEYTEVYIGDIDFFFLGLGVLYLIRLCNKVMEDAFAVNSLEYKWGVKDID